MSITTITIANKDWTILSDLLDALKNTAVKGKPLFERVKLATSEEEAADLHQSGDVPVISVVYKTTREFYTPDDVRGLAIDLVLRIATRLPRGKDKSDTVQEILRLMNGTKNAIENNASSTASAWGDQNEFQQQYEWGEADIDSSTETERTPWAICTLPLTIGYSADSGTEH